MKMVVIGLALLCGGAGEALSSPGVTVDRLARWCQGSAMQRTACDFYFVGALEMLQAAKEAEGAFSRICIPPTGLSANDVREIFLDWVANHPAHRQDDAVVGLQLALADTIPCP